MLPFPEDSAVRRIHGESVMLLGGGRALLLQIAHPAIAAGVAEHSSYRSERWRRLLRTLRPMYAIVFGNRTQALRAAEGIAGRHATVRGTDYDARDPELLLWVLATLIDTALLVHERYLGAVSATEAEDYYAGMCRLGMVLGIPREALPADRAAFHAYFHRTLATLEVSSAAREISGDLFKLTPGAWPAVAAARLVTSGLLPPSLRDQYGLSWGPKRDQALCAAEALSRAVLPRMPPVLRRPPWFLMP
jgi:uncharacterized protein (DUF2236 family)